MSLQNYWQPVKNYFTGANATHPNDPRAARITSKVINYGATAGDVTGVIAAIFDPATGLQIIGGSEVLRNVANYITRPPRDSDLVSRIDQKH